MEKGGGDVQRSCDVRACVAQDKRTHSRRRPRTQPKPQQHSQPKRAPAAKAAAAAHGWANAPTQVKGHAPSSNLGGTTNPNAHRRPKPPQQHPAGQTRQRETKGPGVRVRQDNPTHASPRAQTTRTRQRRAAQAAQTAVGDAQERILFRDDHVANTANVRLRRTKQKALFFGGIPVSFGKTKEMGYKYTELTKYFPPARKVHSRDHRIGHRRQELHRV